MVHRSLIAEPAWLGVFYLLGPLLTTLISGLLWSTVLRRDHKRGHVFVQAGSLLVWSSVAAVVAAAHAVVDPHHSVLIATAGVGILACVVIVYGGSQAEEFVRKERDPDATPEDVADSAAIVSGVFWGKHLAWLGFPAVYVLTFTAAPGWLAGVRSVDGLLTAFRPLGGLLWLAGVVLAALGAFSLAWELLITIPMTLFVFVKTIRAQR